jgi:hypothetical protein
MRAAHKRNAGLRKLQLFAATRGMLKTDLNNDDDQLCLVLLLPSLRRFSAAKKSKGTQSPLCGSCVLFCRAFFERRHASHTQKREPFAATTRLVVKLREESLFGKRADRERSIQVVSKVFDGRPCRASVCDQIDRMRAFISGYGTNNSNHTCLPAC